MTAPQPDWLEHGATIASVVGIFLTILLTVISWLMVRTITKIDQNQAGLFKKYDNHEHRLSTLEGAHAARTGMRADCSG